MTEKTKMRKVNLSLGGVTFKTNEQIKEKTGIKIVLYTKPQMIPIILDGVIVYSKFQSENHYRTSVEFNKLSTEQEQLLAQHILQAQIKKRSD